MSEPSWIKLFPYPTPRKEQVEAIDKILNSFKNGKRFFALEAGTGVGKSAIAITVARALAELATPEGYQNGVHFVTTQKLLQDQYERDFSALKMKSIKSSKNYKCKYKKTNSCGDGQAELKLEPQGSRFWNVCSYNCVYKNAKQEYTDSLLSVTNFPYLLTECNYSGKIPPRKLLVIDEAHNIETELSKFIEISVNERFSKNTLKLSVPIIKTHYQAVEWIKNIYFPKLTSHLKGVETKLEKFGLTHKLEQFVSLQRQVQMMKSHKKKIKDSLFYHTEENWVFDIVENRGGGKKITFKPIDVSQFANQYVFKMGYHVLCMSATLIQTDKFMKMSGIEEENSDSLVIPSPFPSKNRPIMFVPMGKMTSKVIDESLPVIAEAIKRILNEHKGDKGIIHTHSYKVANYLKSNIKSRRLLFPTPEDRDKILRKHIEGNKPTVLISPSMTEGVDLQGDSSRFQILCKVPYPFLGDKLVKKRMNKWKWWYPFQTTKTIIQAIGRSIRSKDDTAVTYILDSDWDRFYSMNKKLFPKDFHDCLK